MWELLHGWVVKISEMHQAKKKVETVALLQMEERMELGTQGRNSLKQG